MAPDPGVPIKRLTFTLWQNQPLCGVGGLIPRINNGGRAQMLENIITFPKDFKGELSL